jgi:hypothetical protein
LAGYRNNPILPERNTIVLDDLQDELAVAPFIEKLIGRQTAERQSA